MVPVEKKAMLNLGPSPIKLSPIIEASENDMTPRSRRISKNSQMTPKPVRKSPNKGSIGDDMTPKSRNSQKNLLEKVQTKVNWEKHPKMI